MSQDVDVNLFRKCYFAHQDLLNTQSCLKINEITSADLQPKKRYTIVQQNAILQNNSMIPNKSTVAQIVIPSSGVRMSLNNINNQIFRSVPQQGQQFRQTSPQNQIRPNQNITLSNQSFPQIIKISPSKSATANNLQCRTLKTINGGSLNIKQLFSIPNSQAQQQLGVNVTTTVPKISNAFSLQGTIFS